MSYIHKLANVLLRGLVIYAVLGLECTYSNDLPSHSDAASVATTDPCLIVMPPCIGEADRFSLEALRHIHKQLDDDNDGGIEVNESVEFIIEDMKQQQTNKHSNLHREDQHITVEELWKAWKISEVHNWTVEDTVWWLKESVELPQYEKNFREFRVTGNTLPRIAANEPSFMSMQLKILDQRHKQKLNLKALDAVLFGPPLRPQHNWMKDFVLMVSIVIGVGGCWFAYVQNKSSKVHISKMMKDLESLQHAEQSLIDLVNCSDELHIVTMVCMLSSVRETAQEGSSDTDSINSSLGRKQLHNPCTPGSETPFRRISREELLFSQSVELPESTSISHISSSSSSSSLRDSTPPPLPSTPATTPSGPPSTSPSPALEHHPFAQSGSPDLTPTIPESQSVTFSQGNAVSPAGKGMYNGVLEKSYSFTQLPASMLTNVGRHPSLTSLDSEGRSVGRDYKLQSASSQDSSDNGEKIKRSSSKIKNLFKKKK